MTRLLFLFAFLAPLALAQSASPAGGDSAADLYHRAASAYIGGENEQAVRDAERALAMDPDNARIQQLLDLLRQQQPPQNGEGEQENQDNEPQDSDEGEPQDQQDGGQNPEPPEGDDEAERDGSQQDTGQPEEQQPQDEQQGRKDQDRQPGEPTPADAGQPRPATMSAAEAQRLLDAVAADEELLVEKIRRPTRQRRSERDW